LEIRAITLFDSFAYPLRPQTFSNAARFARAATDVFAAAGLPPQTLRIASQPFPSWLPAGPEFAPHVAETERAAHEAGFGYLSIGCVRGDARGADLAPLDALPDAMAAAPNAFACVSMASAQNGVSFAGVFAAAQTIRRLAKIEPGGAGNLRFAALGNCAAWCPYFPAAYHGGGRARFSVAMQAADLASEAFRNAVTPDEASGALYHAVDDAANQVAKTAYTLSRRTGVKFAGIDFSLAPAPREGDGFGEAVEALGIERFGAQGTAYAVALAASAIESVRFPRVGFSGVMLPVLEDLAIAAEAAEGHITVNDLLLYSSMCGRGLDLVPLPGDITDDQLAAILIDVAALSVRLNKPLAARLLPIPGKAAGDPTDFPQEYLTNSRVFGMRGALRSDWRTQTQD
jgi:hypothetical protein